MAILKPGYLGSGRFESKVFDAQSFATWGRIISDGQDYITTSWWLVTLPGLVIVLLVVGVNLLGDGLRDRPAGSNLRGLLKKFRPNRSGA